MPAAAPPPIIYHCPGGPTVVARFEGAKTVILHFAGHDHTLKQALSADGGRYVGAGWQWWIKGANKAALDRLPPGQDIAPATRWCVARPG